LSRGPVCNDPQEKTDRFTVGFRTQEFASKSKGALMSFRSSDAAIDEIVANCGGDIRGALKALLLVNEHLEAEIAELYAAVADSGLVDRRNCVLH
jgi:hypothetical protein